MKVLLQIIEKLNLSEKYLTLLPIHNMAYKELKQTIISYYKNINKSIFFFIQGYGMTESAPVTFCMPKLIPPSKIGTIGIPYPGTEAKVISLVTGESLGTHQSGELLVRGPQVGNIYT